MKAGLSPRLCTRSLYLPDVPVAIVLPASRSIFLILLPVAIVHRLEVTADAISIAIFACWPEGPIAVAVFPAILLADRATEPIIVAGIGITLIIAIDVAGKRIAGDSANYYAARDRAAISMTHRAADQATGNSAKDRPGRLIAAMTVALVRTLSIIAVLRRRRRCRRTVTRVGTVAATVITIPAIAQIAAQTTQLVGVGTSSRVVQAVVALVISLKQMNFDVVQPLLEAPRIARPERTAVRTICDGLVEVLLPVCQPRIVFIVVDPDRVSNCRTGTADCCSGESYGN